MVEKVIVHKASCIALVMGVFTLAANAAVISWDASSGLTPDQVGFELSDSSSPENPILASSILTIGNNSASERMFYATREPTAALLFPSVFEAFFRMKFVSSSTSYAGRRAAGILVTVNANTGSNLYIGNDSIFLSADFTQQGPSATVDTNDEFHDYVLRIEGTEVSVFQDGSLVLSGNTLDSEAAEIGTSPRVLFGDVTSLAYGTSEWQSFSHNAMAIPEPSSIVLMGGMGLALFRLRKNLFR